MGSVNCERAWTATILVSATAAINILGNVFGAALTFVFFGILEPRLNHGAEFTFDGFWDRALVFAAVVGMAFAIIGPINGRWVWSLYREVRNALEPNPSLQNPRADPQKLRIIGGKASSPAGQAGWNNAGWLDYRRGCHFRAASHGASAIPVASHYFLPNFRVVSSRGCSRNHELGILRSGAMASTEDPKTTSSGYPCSGCRSPIGLTCFPKLLAVFIVVSIVPVALISHITLHQISEVQAGRQSIANFLDGVPTVIGFLLATFGAMAVGLSIMVARSVSEPLRNVGAAMDAVRAGDLDVRVPVVSNDEIGQMSDGFNRMVREHKELDSIRDTFGRYVSQEVVTEILKSPGGVDLMGEIRDITILVADLRGFTQIADSLEPRKVLELINRFLQEMTDVILSHQGTIDEFTGDGILVFFGAPRVLPDHSLRAVTCALEMQEAMTQLNCENVKLGFPELRMGIGINRGELIIGNIGSEKRKKYGAVGSPINIAFRIEAETRGGDILVSPTVRERLNGLLIFEQRAAAHLKGLEKPLNLYEPRGFVLQLKS